MHTDNTREIRTLAALHGAPELADEALARGLSVRAFKQGLRRLDAARNEPRNAFGLGGDQLEQYSVCRAISVLLGDEKGPSLEREISDTLARSMPEGYKSAGGGGIFVPMAAGARAALTSSTSTAASQLVFTAPGTLIEKLRARMVTTRMGATFLPGLTSPVGFPRQTGAGTAYWCSENPTNDVSESNLTVDLVTLTPKTIQATQAVTRQLLAQSGGLGEKIVTDDLAAIHARAWDKAALHGAGGAEPTGIYAASGVSTVAVGATASAWYGKLADMATECSLDDADMGNQGYVCTPGFAGKLMQTLDFATASAGGAIWRGTHADGIVAGYAASSTNQASAALGVSSNEHACIFGNWSDLLIGTWGVLELIVDPFAKKKKGIIEVTSFQMVDIQLRHGESFCKGTGIKVS